MVASYSLRLRGWIDATAPFIDVIAAAWLVASAARAPYLALFTLSAAALAIAWRDVKRVKPSLVTLVAMLSAAVEAVVWIMGHPLGENAVVVWPLIAAAVVQLHFSAKACEERHLLGREPLVLVHTGCYPATGYLPVLAAQLATLAVAAALGFYETAASLAISAIWMNVAVFFTVLMVVMINMIMQSFVELDRRLRRR